MCPRTLSDRHDQTETDRALCFFSTGSQRTNSSLQTGGVVNAERHFLQNTLATKYTFQSRLVSK